MGRSVISRALDALTDSVKAVVWGGAKGATAEARVTSSTVNADRQALDTRDAYAHGKFQPGVRVTKAGVASALGANVLHSPAADKRVRLWWIGWDNAVLTPMPQVVIKFEDALTEVYRWKQDAFSHWEPVDGPVGKDLLMDLSAASAVNWNITYEEVD